MKAIRAISVDDEDSARDVLAYLLQKYCPDVTLVAQCRHLAEAAPIIAAERPDVVFLDIEMPDYAGYEIGKFFKEINFAIIFITAYDQYALRAFELAALDYLLKPIEIDRLIASVQRVRKANDPELLQTRLSVMEDNLLHKEVNNIIVVNNSIQCIVPVDTIIAIEAQESYSYIHTTSQRHTVSKNLKHFEMLFENSIKLFRIHKSWIINVNFVERYSKLDGLVYLKNGMNTKLSRYKKKAFEALIYNV